MSHVNFVTVCSSSNSFAQFGVLDHHLNSYPSLANAFAGNVTLPVYAIFGNLFTFPVTGETKAVYYAKDDLKSWWYEFSDWKFE